MESIVIIESPFQLLSAVEAQNKFNINKLILIIKYTNTKKTNDQIDWILSKNPFYKVIKLPKFKIITLNDFLLIFLILLWKIRKKSFDYILIGEPRSVIMNSFILNFRSNKYYFIDDGSATIVLQNQILNNEQNIFKDKNNSLLIKSRLLLSNILGIKHNFNLSPHFFTCFNLKPSTGQEIIIHNFEKTTNQINKCNESKTNTVFFIGGNLSELNALSEKHELFLFSSITKFYHEQKINIIYCPHRRESKSKLNKIKSIDPSIELYYSEFPIELEFIIKNIHVEHIASFCSTALYTLTLIFKPKTTIMFKVPVNYISSTFLIDFKDLEENYTNNGLVALNEEYLQK